LTDLQLQVHNFASMQNYQIKKRKITKLQIEKLQDYNLHVLICKFQIYTIINFSIYIILKYQNCKYMFANMQNYKLQVHVLKFTSL
jgi:hypothetical protein